VKCTICGKSKGKRGCEIRSGQFICPLCCANIRNEECSGCGHYKASQAYQREKSANAIGRKKFTTLIMPEVEDACDRALELLENGNIIEGEEILQYLLEEYPNYHTIFYGLGVCCGLKGEMPLAITYFERAVEIFPLFTAAYVNLGMSHMKNFDIANAVRAYQNVIDLDGEDGEYGAMAKERLDDLDRISRKSHGLSLQDHLKNQRVFQRAFDALRKREFQRAVELFNQVLHIDPNNVQSWGNLGLAYAGLGEKKRALECLDKALALDPKYEPAAINRFALEKSEDGKDVFGQGRIGEIEYYRDYRLQGKSCLQEPK
jgi:tetratricopeptide (TPR) repeat protein